MEARSKSDMEAGNDAVARQNFCAFLARVARGQVEVEDWNRHAITRYPDPELEAARAALVRASLIQGQCTYRTVAPDLLPIAQELLVQLTAR